MPTLPSWKNVRRKVVRRYKGTGVDYQVWNEANVIGFWAGSPAKMAELTKVDLAGSSTATTSRRDGRQPGACHPAHRPAQVAARRSTRSETGGKPVARWVDVVSLNLYPGPKRAAGGVDDAARRVTHHAQSSPGVHKPIWNTEINYGLQTGGGGTAARSRRKRQAAYVARTYVLNAANGVRRCSGTRGACSGSPTRG